MTEAPKIETVREFCSATNILLGQARAVHHRTYGTEEFAAAKDELRKAMHHLQEALWLMGDL